MKDNARQTALDILVDYERKGTYPNLALKNRLRGVESDLDRSFITRIVYSTIERKITLDYYISVVSSVKLKKINPVVLAILRMGLCQIALMSVPANAACNSSVELAKLNGQTRSAGFVNAVLRKLAVGYKDIPMPDDKEKAHLVKYSVCADVYRIIERSIGERAANELLSARDTGELFICVNSLKTDVDSLVARLKTEGVNAEETEFGGLLKISGRSVDTLSSFSEGLFHVIGFASYIAARLAAPAEGASSVDMCAAPGGKLFTMAYLSGDKARITAFDLHEHKIKNIMSTIDRLGLRSVAAKQADCTVFDPDFENSADTVLCDVPCSGLGVIAKKPDIRYKQIDEQSLVSVQFAILSNAARYLKPGGRLVYSTCTVNTAENGELIRRFIETDGRFEIDKSEHIYNNEYGEKQFLPGRDGTDGFYVAVLKKK